MMEKNLILADLQKQMKETENEEVKIMINELIANVLTGKYDIRIWS